MKKNSICIVIPIYKNKLNKDEDLSIKVSKEKLKGYDFCFVTFRELDLTEYRRYCPFKVFYFPKRFFNNEKTYSRLLLSPLFYLRFIKYQYICIIQTDAMVMGTAGQLEKFTNLKYDYIGAPWKRSILTHRFEPSDHFWLLELFPKAKKKLMGEGILCDVGNGGLSLRNIRNTIKLLLKYWLSCLSWYENEDLFFAYYGIQRENEFRLPSREIAGQFAQETTAPIDMGKGIYPFGIHAWKKYYPSLLDRDQYFFNKKDICEDIKRSI